MIAKSKQRGRGGEIEEGAFPASLKLGSQEKVDLQQKISFPNPSPSKCKDSPAATAWTVLQVSVVIKLCWSDFRVPTLWYEIQNLEAGKRRK